MSEKIRETQVDADGHVVGRTEIERPRRRGGSFGVGLLFGAIILAGAIAAYAYSQGSFETAGARADRATEVAQTDINHGVENAGDAAKTAGNNIENATDNATN